MVKNESKPLFICDICGFSSENHEDILKHLIDWHDVQPELKGFMDQSEDHITIIEIEGGEKG
ncbi:MAG: hypothetical protein AB1466_01540 [Actinomycetota bacterium]